MVPSASLLVLVKLQVRPGQSDTKFATGGWSGVLTPTLCEAEAAAPWLSVTVNVTV